MVGAVLVLAIVVVSIVGWTQIIKKAGYSPAWILVPLSLPALMVITLIVTFSNVSNSVGTYNVSTFQNSAGDAEVLGWLILLDCLVNFVMFCVFAFSEWPTTRGTRGYPGSGAGGRGPGGGLGGPGGDRRRSPSYAFTSEVAMMPPPPDFSGQPPGWYKSGPTGAGEQSYWDGQAVTARRQWRGAVWVDLPLDGVAGHVPSPAGSSG
jgi:hypothetical protein